MNGNWEKVGVAAKFVVDANGTQSLLSLTREMRYFDDESFERELEDLKRSICSIVESAVRREVVAQIR